MLTVDTNVQVGAKVVWHYTQQLKHFAASCM